MRHLALFYFRTFSLDFHIYLSLISPRPLYMSDNFAGNRQYGDIAKDVFAV